GFKTYKGGRIGELAAEGLSDQLKEENIIVGRLKTGTSARLDGRSVNFKKMTEQKGDGEGRCFSYLHNFIRIENEKSCFITFTNEEAHNELRKGLKFSPLFTGKIKGRGPRYCPSIEDKIVTFKNKKSHQLFIEPEGRDTVEYYVNGFASSLPLEAQLNALRKINGLEDVNIYRPGYAIEYDFFQPTQLKHSLESKIIKGLFFAGQVNGTTGYEEAAAQGIMAGINAVLKINNNETFVLGRDEAYIGVLIDDLVIKGVDEPYRMFTSRAEYRILLRQDNADERLSRKGEKIGTVSKERIQRLEEKEEMIKEIIDFLKKENIAPDEINKLLEENDTAKIHSKVKAYNIVLRPQISLSNFLSKYEKAKKLKVFKSERFNEIVESAEIDIKYNGYIEREKLVADKIKRLEELKLPQDIDYNKLLSISTEGRQKLDRIKPSTIGQASRISGVSPSDIHVLLMYMGR
ncbi:MAG TPA: tRNA uridine-5-carboxymethylaminomethyl(34) synthesis enzyme MnmG, partial [Bacteroidales bacterium]|nr:tRNA uridine-5-carboxymethylaminomethyl(34) synthesis enzyme MnmG [Bacteroidales bacterium]